MNTLRSILKILVFNAVATHHSFTKTVEFLGVSKSIVSQETSQLEYELGESLLNCTTRGLSSTSIGKQFFGKFAPLQDQLMAFLKTLTIQLKNHADNSQ